MDPPSDAQRLLWRGARLLGLQPFGPEVRALSSHQLRWALIRNAEESGGDPIKDAKAAAAAQSAKDALDLVVWFDKHITSVGPR